MHHVHRQVAGLRERLATRNMVRSTMFLRTTMSLRLADMRLLPLMGPRVPSQVAGRRERLAACLADMRLLPRMREHVAS